MELYRILDKNCCTMELESRQKEDCLRELVRLAANSPLLENFDQNEIYEKLSERESQGSTGIGDEFAIPHTRIEGMDDFLLLVAISRKGIDFDAIDGKRVKIFILILGPAERVDDHLMILASVSSVIERSGVKRELLTARTPAIVYETFARHSSIVHAAEGKTRRNMKMLVLVLYLDELLHHVLEFFITEGIEGATIFDSTGMGEYISNVPIFASFIGFMNKSKTRSTVILAMVPEEREAEMIDGIENICGDLDKKEGAMVMTLDVSSYKGSMKMM